MRFLEAPFHFRRFLYLEWVVIQFHSLSALLTFNKNLREVETAKNELEPWGLLFSPDLSKVEGAKQIPPETIFVGEDATIEPNPQGNPMEWVDWSRQMRNNVTLINAQQLQRW